MTASSLDPPSARPLYPVRMKTVELRYADVAAMRDDHAKSLSVSRAFVVGATGLGERETCELAVIHPVSGLSFVLGAEVVWLAPNGVGLSLARMDAAKKAELAAFVADDGGPSTADAPAAATEQAATEPPAAEPPAAEASAEASVTHDEGEWENEQKSTPNVHERVRGLTARERDDVARRGTMPERVALERAYGGAVWEGLLQNPGLTVVEVAKIARNGTLPRPLVNTIVSNAGWLASTEVQRALLSNPRCGGSHLDRVLGAMKPADLARLAHQCPYRQEVRAAVLRHVRP